MCTHQPGEVLALVRRDMVPPKELLDRLPGAVRRFPLLPEPREQRREYSGHLEHFDFLHVVEIPEGLEINVVSQLSAIMHEAVSQDLAVVDLNFQLSYATDPQPDQSWTLTAAARRQRERVRAIPVRRDGTVGTVGIIDSGVNLSELSENSRNRAWTFFDYAFDRGDRFGETISADHDRKGHGTKVCRVLEECLPDNTAIVSGRLTSRDAWVTVLRVASGFAHMVVYAKPSVINLSLAPKDDVRCEKCGSGAAAPTFQSLILSYVFNLAPQTIVVMAAGNRGQASNTRHGNANSANLILVEAVNSLGEIAPYSNRVDGQFAAVARAFGGDGTSDGTQVFARDPGTYGTSFAAPFVAAAAARILPPDGWDGREDRATDVFRAIRHFLNEDHGLVPWGRRFRDVPPPP